jgi:hypothetical protein
MVLDRRGVGGVHDDLGGGEGRVDVAHGAIGRRAVHQVAGR